MKKEVTKLLTKMFVSSGPTTDIVSVRDHVVVNIAGIVDKYVDWYAEQGLTLPSDYATDPAEWTNCLRKIQTAFRLLLDEMNGEGKLWEAKNSWKEYGEQDTQSIDDLNKEIQEGLTLFGKYLFHLTDKLER